MPLTNAERVAAWRKRQREDPERYREYQRKERERYKSKKERGVVKPVSELGERAQRRQRRDWRATQFIKRKKDTQIKRQLAAMVTPPVSPTAPLVVGPGRADNMRRMRRRERGRSNKELYKLQIKLKENKKEKEMYKKRYQRLIAKGGKGQLDKKVNGIIKRNEEKKALLMNQVIIQRIRSRYMRSMSQNEKQMISSIVCSYNLLRKLKLADYARKKLGFSTHSFNSTREGTLKKRERNQGAIRLKEKVGDFLNRDDNSRIKAGKKSTITRRGDKRQIRLLSDDLLNLHAKFLTESNCKVSYSLFCSLRPFNTMKPTAKDRDTCQCKIHENLKFKIEKCHQINVLPSSSIDSALSKITCDPENKACMYRECKRCEDKKLEIDLTDPGKQVTWMAWKTRREDREKTVKGQSTAYFVNITVKDEEFGTLEILSEELNKDLQRASRHIFNIRHQYKALHLLKSQITSEDLIIHIDFSENYNCKYSEEIQSMHFGASQRQISLHTGVAYSKDKTFSFCTVSDCLKHGPAAIWAHLDPVLVHLKEETGASVVHFISDGPTTQYRNKHNFYLFSNQTYQYGFVEAIWNFLEAAHGKGAADGIGAVIKRAADKLVHVQSKDIPNARILHDQLSEMNTKVKLFLIGEDDINSLESGLPSDLKPLPKTMQIHQLLTTRPGDVQHRVLSCFCQKPAKCDCFGLTVSSFPIQKQQKICAAPIVDTDVAELIKIQVVEESLVSQYCVVRYDDRPYPGVILTVDDDEELEVQVMHCIGKNRYFWPMIEDVLWYTKQDIATLLRDAPKPVTKRHHEIDRRVWPLIESEMDLD